jgi:hypothetical protein
MVIPYLSRQLLFWIVREGEWLQNDRIGKKNTIYPKTKRSPSSRQR